MSSTPTSLDASRPVADPLGARAIWSRLPPEPRRLSHHQPADGASRDGGGDHHRALLRALHPVRRVPVEHGPVRGDVPLLLPVDLSDRQSCSIRTTCRATSRSVAQVRATQWGSARTGTAAGSPAGCVNLTRFTLPADRRSQGRPSMTAKSTPDAWRDPAPLRDLCLGCGIQDHFAVRTAAAVSRDRIYPPPPPPRLQFAHLKAIAGGDTMQERPCCLALHGQRTARSTPGTELISLSIHLRPSSPSRVLLSRPVADGCDLSPWAHSPLVLVLREAISLNH